MSGNEARFVGSRLALVALGAAAPTVLGWLTNLVKYSWRQFLRRPKCLLEFGEWAVVTGATDGIGRAYCDRFAEKGLNLLLISRSKEKLAKVAAELESQHQVECKCHAIDLVEAAAFSIEEQIWTDLRDVISSIDVGLVVNNAGICYSYPERFKDLDTATLHQIPAINISSLVKMTYLVLPQMTERRRGVVINLSSLATARPTDGTALTALYTASKVFVDNFSASLAEECKPDGVHVQVHAPGFVQTKMFVQSGDVFTLSPEEYSRQAVRRIGYERFSVPGTRHAINRALVAALPRSAFLAANWSVAIEKRGQALQEIQAGTRTPIGTLASTEALSAKEQEDLIYLRF